VRLVCLPPYTPELQPADRLWALVDELDGAIAARCVTLGNEREIIRKRTGCHRWLKIANAS